jgi:isoquinoline 1-oxidoreductase alpha subunit
VTELPAFKLNVNGKPAAVRADADTPLLWVLRDLLGLYGTKFGCGIAQCGACTVHINGQPVRSCSIPLSEAVHGEITTIEGAKGPAAKAVIDAWTARNVPQCGYCQSGQVMSAIALLSEVPAPSDEDIDTAMSGNICRCGTYFRIRAAIHDAAAQLAKA